MAVETKVRVSAFRVTIQCSLCSGHMEFTHVMLPTDPPKYPHRCVDCGHTMILPMAYPHIEFEEESECLASA